MPSVQPATPPAPVQPSRSAWRAALPWAALLATVVLGLFYYWFAVADRYAIFLYGHTTTNIAAAQPFDDVTSSRYWMAGLVAAGAVLVGYSAAVGIVGRLWRGFEAPAGWRVWALCAGPLLLGIPAITLTVNTPTLPPALAAACTAAALAGLAPAALAGEWAARRPGDLAWLAADGLALVPALTLMRAIELPGRGLSVTLPVAWGVALGGVVAGLVWLGIMSGLRAWRRRPAPAAPAVLLAGLAISYLFFPLVHHLIATPPGFRYITTASNFFAFGPAVQALALGVAAAQAGGITWLRQRPASAGGSGGRPR
ncbi:MAG: hypothetical protein JNK29_00385 [Anaerolineales bacterium]|nr:hypothetical protein [Anaerolineales bacterium]